MDSLHINTSFSSDTSTTREIVSDESRESLSTQEESPHSGIFEGIKVVSLPSRETPSSLSDHSYDYSCTTSRFSSPPTLSEESLLSAYTIVISSDEKECLSHIAHLEHKKQALLLEIKPLQEQKTFFEVREKQYLENLSTSLSFLEKAILATSSLKPFSVENNFEAKAFEEVADHIKNLSILIKNNLWNAQTPTTEVTLKFAQNAIEFYQTSLVHTNKEELSEACIAFYRGYINLCITKINQAKELSLQDSFDYYTKAANSYQEAIECEKNKDHLDATLHAKKAELFYKTALAYEYKKNEVASLYIKATECYSYILTTNLEMPLLEKAARAFEKAAAVSPKQSTLTTAYTKAGECYFAAVYRKEVSFEQSTTLLKSLTRAGDHFFSQGEALEQGLAEKAEIHDLLGNCLEQQVDSFYTSNESLSSHLQTVEDCFKQALKNLEGKKVLQEAAHFYKKAGLASMKVVDPSYKKTTELWDSIANTYYMIGETLESDSEDRNTITSLLKASAKYKKVIADLMNDEKATVPKEVIFCIRQSSFFLERSSQILENKRPALAAEYEKAAAASYYLAVAQYPPLVEHLPEGLRLGFKKESPIQENLITYWQGIVRHYEKTLGRIESFTTLRPQAFSIDES